MGSSWKVAYADFMTAMMAFFLLMWILNMTPPEAKQGLAACFAADKAFQTTEIAPISNNPFILDMSNISEQEFKISEAEKSHQEVAQKLSEMLMADSVPQSSTGISSDDVGVQLRISSDAMFKPGTAELLPDAGKVLAGVVSVMREYNLNLVVRGHTDSVEQALPPYNSSWELSGARAAAVLRYLVDAGHIKSTRLRGVAYGDTRPLEPGGSAESQAKNRRVDFVFHRPEIMSYGIVY